MLFEWDKRKNKSNKIKHGLSFNEAKEVFEDPNKITKKSTKFDHGEDRFNTVGRIDLGTKVSVIHTPRKSPFGENTTRIISARGASKKEKKWYQL